MRKLASIQKIDQIKPIPNADNIVLVTLVDMDWQMIAKKEEFKPGDLCVFFEIDSILPPVEWAAFMEPRGYRVKTLKLRGVISQGLVLPLNILPSDYTPALEEDVSELLGVTKYDPQTRNFTGTRNQGRQKGTFHPLIAKTDETRIQTYKRQLSAFKEAGPFVATIKLDGSSATFVREADGTLRGFSRNFERDLSEPSDYATIATRYDLANKLPPGHVVQGELVGPGWQGNKLKLDELDFFVFNVLRLPEAGFATLVDHDEGRQAAQSWGLKVVPEAFRVDNPEEFDYSTANFLTLAEGKYANTNNHREGIVCRPLKQPDPKQPLSFKVINNTFLLKGGD